MVVRTLCKNEQEDRQGGSAGVRVLYGGEDHVNTPQQIRET